MSNIQGRLSSNTCEWHTPRDFFAKLDSEFHFETDVCATTENALCEKYYTMAEDGLEQTWTGVCWMNPPYGRTIGKWVQKAYESSIENGATVVCLLPVRTDTKWWHEYCAKSNDIRFVRGRLRFTNSKMNAPFPSVVVVFHGCTC